MPISSQVSVGIHWKVQRSGREARTVNNVHRWGKYPPKRLTPHYFKSKGEDMIRHYNESYRLTWKVMLSPKSRKVRSKVTLWLTLVTCHPNYMNWVRKTYMEIMAEISDSTLIDDILSKLYGKPIRIKKMSSSISEEILNGEYALN